MASPFVVRGGAQIEWVSASWPLARLSATATVLSVSGSIMGSYSFTPEQVVSLEPHGSLPILGRGVRIVHSNPNYPSKIVFWCFRDPEGLIEDIRQVGFLPRSSPARATTREGIPVRWSVIIVLSAVWNILFLLDGFVPWNLPKSPGPLVLLALAGC